MKKLPKAIVRSPIKIGDIELTCAVLDNKDNTRILSAASIFKAFGRAKRGRALDDPRRVLNLPAFIDAKNLQNYINQDIVGVLKTIEYEDGNQVILKLGHSVKIFGIVRSTK